jgi:hypothetical protein
MGAGINDYIITLDVDWASDDVINYVADKFIEKNVKATWFITHDSQAVRKLFTYPDLFEIGWHPNFMSGSTHGKNPEEVLKHIKNIYPDAISVRTHGLFQSSPLLKLLRDKFEIKYDSSIFLPYTSHIQPHVMYYQGSKEFIRLPYFWADYTETNMKDADFSISNPKYHVEGMKIFNFHPIHIALNTSTLDTYDRLKAKVNMQECKQSNIDEYRNKGVSGAENIFLEVIKINVTKGGGKLLREVGQEWFEKNSS